MRSSPSKEKNTGFLEAAKGALRRRLPRKTPQLIELFDADWYIKGFRDAIDDPWAHYLEGGFLKGNPNSMFDTDWYLDRHPELRDEKKNPLVHYLEAGERAGDAPSARFDPKWYLGEYPDVAATNLSPLLHYLKFGAAEGRLPKRLVHLDSFGSLADFLSDLAPSYAARPCSIELPVGSVSSLMEPGGGGRIVYEAAGGFCEGIDGPPAYPEAAFVAEIKDSILVAGTRYVITPSGRLLHDENAYFFDEEGAAIKYAKARRSSTGGRLSLEATVRQAAWVERGLNVMHEYENNYFHFIAETFPRMLLAEEGGVPSDVPYLCTGELHPNIEMLFGLANTADRPVIRLEKGTLYRVGQMYYPSDLTSVVDAYQGGAVARQTGLDVERIRRAIDICRRRISIEPSSARRRIFAARDGAYRNLLNQAEIEARMTNAGFEVVRADTLGLEEQIRIFGEAEIIVGPTGAQMTNLVWCRPGAKIIVLASDHPSHQLYLWQLLGRVSGADVRILQGPRAYARNDIYSVHDDYRVDEDAVISAALGM